MDFGIDFLISSIQPKDVVIFPNPELNSVDPHMYICIGNHNNEYQFLIASTQSTTIYKRVAITRQPSQTAVNIKPSKECPFHKETWVNCNNVKSFTKEQLKTLFGKDFKRTGNRMPQPVFEELINGVCLSELVNEELIDHLNSAI